MSKSFFERLGGSSPVFDPNHNFVTSPFFSSAALATLRGLVAVYALFVLIFALVWENVRTHDGSGFFSYFTQLTYIGLCSYYWASFVQTVAYARKGQRGYPLQKWGKTLQVLHMMLATTIVSYPILVTIVFWALLASSKTFSTVFSTWDNVSFHALNTVFSLFEMLFTNSPPPPWLMVPFIIIILALYLGLAYLTHFTQGFYTYSFLDPEKEHGLLVGYIIGILVASLILFSLVKGVMTLRRRLTNRNCTASSLGGGQFSLEGSIAHEKVSGNSNGYGDVDVERGISPWTDIGTMEGSTEKDPAVVEKRDM
ncbi:hypothetical protein D9758_005027 [Tetrapyrgos nigripes]|uniref:Uncharacterized protein n=1 Tax=Tetrapyrgos nigripes TaxID=182062 RepID=A0A8H5LWS4_9AGAR|nr:hypothetical protein D9758_005027 [Tetrapyrgos nigripes]